MWLTAYSMCGRLSKTTALPSLRIWRSSSVVTSAVFWFASISVPWKMLPRLGERRGSAGHAADGGEGDQARRRRG